MSAVSVRPIPSQLWPNRPRPRVQPSDSEAMATLTSEAVPTTSSSSRDVPIHTVLVGQELTSGDPPSTAGRVRAKISFAPGTTFEHKSRLRSRGSRSSLKLGVASSLRPVTSVDAGTQLRFKVPRSTLPTLTLVSATQGNFCRPYKVPGHDIRSSLILSSARKSGRTPTEGGAVVRIDSRASQTTLSRLTTPLEPETEVGRATTSAVTRMLGLCELSDSAGSPSANQRSHSAHVNAKGSGRSDEVEEGELSTASGTPQLPAHQRLLHRERTMQVRLFPPVNPFRSGTDSGHSSSRSYTRDKKGLDSGRFRPPARADNSRSASSLLREATMYDLNQMGTVERPLDGVLPPPDRKPSTRQDRRQHVKNERRVVLVTDNTCDLMITPREKISTNNVTGQIKANVKR